jgi:HNH endonuclease
MMRGPLKKSPILPGFIVSTCRNFAAASEKFPSERFAKSPQPWDWKSLLSRKEISSHFGYFVVSDSSRNSYNQGMTKEHFYGLCDKRDGCWEWKNGLNHGYGRAYHDKRRWGAHQLSYFFTHGSIPDGLFICHKCDNPKCVNPDHLYAGTGRDNMRDRTERGRFSPARGERSGMARLTEEQVKWIRKVHLPNDKKFGARPIARRLGVGRTTVRWVVKGETWTHAIIGPHAKGEK